MVTVYRCKFLKLYEGTKEDKTKFYILNVLEETEKGVKVLRFFVDNTIALNLRNFKNFQDIAISFDLWFTNENNLRYKINKIVAE